MDIISLSPLCSMSREFESDDLLCYTWNCDLNGCCVHGVAVQGELAARIAWQAESSFGTESSAVEVICLQTLYRLRHHDYAGELVDYIRLKYPDRPLVFEVNTPWSYHFWQRYNPVPLGQDSGYSTFMMIQPVYTEQDCL